MPKSLRSTIYFVSRNINFQFLYASFGLNKDEKNNHYCFVEQCIVLVVAIDKAITSK